MAGIVSGHEHFQETVSNLLMIQVLSILTPSDLDVWMILACGAPLPGTTLFLAVFIELWVTHYRDPLTAVGQRECSAAIQTLLIGT